MKVSWCFRASFRGGHQVIYEVTMCLVYDSLYLDQRRQHLVRCLIFASFDHFQAFVQVRRPGQRLGTSSKGIGTTGVSFKYFHVDRGSKIYRDDRNHTAKTALLSSVVRALGTYGEFFHVFHPMAEKCSSFGGRSRPSSFTMSVASCVYSTTKGLAPAPVFNAVLTEC